MQVVESNTGLMDYDAGWELRVEMRVERGKNKNKWLNCLFVWAGLFSIGWFEVTKYCFNFWKYIKSTPFLYQCSAVYVYRTCGIMTDVWVVCNFSPRYVFERNEHSKSVLAFLGHIYLNTWEIYVKSSRFINLKFFI